MPRKTKNISKRLKTSHKKNIIKRTTAYTHVEKNIAKLNTLITKSVSQQQKENPLLPTIPLESISFDELKKLLGV